MPVVNHRLFSFMFNVLRYIIKLIHECGPMLNESAVQKLMQCKQLDKEISETRYLAAEINSVKRIKEFKTVKNLGLMMCGPTGLNFANQF